MADVQKSQLQYLGFIRVTVVKLLSIASSLYVNLKEKSGFLKPGLDNVEGTVKTVVGPVYTKLEGKPDEILLFVDKKVNDVVKLVSDYTPDFLKTKASEVFIVARDTPSYAKALYEEVHDKGAYETSRKYYEKYEPSVASSAYGTWKWALSFPLVPQVVSILTPPALFGAEKYNDLVSTLKSSDVPLAKPLAAYLPTVPIESIEKTVKADTDEVLKKNE